MVEKSRFPGIFFVLRLGLGPGRRTIEMFVYRWSTILYPLRGNADGLI